MEPHHLLCSNNCLKWLLQLLLFSREENWDSEEEIHLPKSTQEHSGQAGSFYMSSFGGKFLIFWVKKLSQCGVLTAEESNTRSYREIYDFLMFPERVTSVKTLISPIKCLLSLTCENSLQGSIHSMGHSGEPQASQWVWTVRVTVTGTDWECSCWFPSW